MPRTSASRSTVWYARTVLSRLGQLLRVTLDKTQRDKVSLEREIDYIANYLGIETMRFRDRLQVDFDIPAERYPARSLKRAFKWLKDNW